MPASEPPSTRSSGWLEPVLWALGLVIAITVAAFVNDTAREITLQGAAYLFAFVTTPFLLETSAAFIGICVVFAINGRRIAKEGDGWVVMEVKKPDEAKQDPAEPQEKAG
jgi:hypothetical protein